MRALKLRNAELSDASAAALFLASSARAAPHVRLLASCEAGMTQATARALAATGWRLEELDLNDNFRLGAAGFAALVAAPTFAPRRLVLQRCGLGVAALLALATAPWPLEELDLSRNNFSAAAAGPALAALSGHARLRRLDVSHCRLSAACFAALVEGAWPALTYLNAHNGITAQDPHALGAAAFAGFPALEELDVSWMELHEPDLRALTIQPAARLPERLKRLVLCDTPIGGAGVAEFARGAWRALEALDLRGCECALTLEDARRWAPALANLQVEDSGSEESEQGDGEPGA